MFYVVVIAVVLFALYLIFKDDHDRSYNQTKYNKKEKSAPQPPVVQKPVQEVKPVTQEQKVVPPREEPPVEESTEEEPQEEELDLSFLDTLDYYEFLDENTETFDIDEVQDFCNLYDAGTIVGVVKPETWSLIPRPGAKAIFDHEGGRLGFIPSTQLKWFNEFNQQEVVCPFVGRIDIDENGGLVGEIKAIIPTSREFVEKEIREGLQ
ncbi:MAG: hypothetical protein J6X25_04185 [Bacteroidales bacterium]|nr:hypothetical protein [Bacteroidales bacterium]